MTPLKRLRSKSSVLLNKQDYDSKMRSMEETFPPHKRPLLECMC